MVPYRELDSADSKPVTQKFEQVRIGWTAPAKGTAGWLSEFRIWNRERNASEIRADFDRSYGAPISKSALSDTSKPAESQFGAPPVGLVGLFAGNSWGKLHGGAKVTKTADFPPLLTTAEAAALAEKFSKFHALAEQPGDMAKGRALFLTTCMGCHSVAGQGGQIGPVLNGAGALGVEALLRNILTPNATGASGVTAAPLDPRHVIVEVVTPDGTPCREGVLTAFWSRSRSPDSEELNTLLSQGHGLMTPLTEPLRSLEVPIAGAETVVELPADAAELQIAASVAGRRPSARVTLNDRDSPEWSRVRLVVDESPPEGRFMGTIITTGERRVPRGLTIGVGTEVAWPPPNHGVRIDALAATFEIEPRPAGAFYLWITSDETFACRVDIGAGDRGRDVELERGGTLELTLQDVTSGDPLPSVDLLVTAGMMVVTRWGDSTWTLKGE